MSVNRNILKLAVPSILANITVPIVGMVDIAVAGHLDAISSGTIRELSISCDLSISVIKDFDAGRLLIS